MNSPEQNRLAWVALTLTPGLGPKRILRAAKALPDLSSLFRLSLTELEAFNFPAPAAQFLFTGKARTEAERELVRITGFKTGAPSRNSVSRQKRSATLSGASPPAGSTGEAARVSLN